jgi:hypothetical protein
MYVGYLDEDCLDSLRTGFENIDLRKLKIAKNKNIVHMFSFTI